MSRLTLILIASAGMLAGPAAAERPAPAPSAREVVERQLAKRPATPPPGLTAQEAAAIRAQYLKRIGAPPIGAGAAISSAPSR